MHITDDEAKKVTLQSYNTNAEEYFNKVRNDGARAVAYWPGVAFFLSKLPKGESIFEIGSGSGSDALRIENHGYVVQRSDITEAFVRHLRAAGHETVSYDVLEETTADKQAAIFANAVFLHFTIGQFRRALANVYESLADNGLFCIGMKLGDFEGWRERGLGEKRYFKFWHTDALLTELHTAGFSMLSSYVTPAKDYVVVTCER